MLANSVSKYLNGYGVSLGKEIVIFTNNDSAYQTAIDFYNHKINVAAVVDVRNNIEGDLPLKVKSLGIKIYTSSIISNTTAIKVMAITK